MFIANIGNTAKFTGSQAAGAVGADLRNKSSTFSMKPSRFSTEARSPHAFSEIIADNRCSKQLRDLSSSARER